MAAKTFNVSMDEELVKKIDAAAKAQYASRSDFLRMASLKELKENISSGETKILAAKKIMHKHRQDFINLANR